MEERKASVHSHPAIRGLTSCPDIAISAQRCLIEFLLTQLKDARTELQAVKASSHRCPDNTPNTPTTNPNDEMELDALAAEFEELRTLMANVGEKMVLRGTRQAGGSLGEQLKAEKAIHGTDRPDSDAYFQQEAGIWDTERTCRYQYVIYDVRLGGALRSCHLGLGWHSGYFRSLLRQFGHRRQLGEAAARGGQMLVTLKLVCDLVQIPLPEDQKVSAQKEADIIAY
ncbi:hypothetical protein C8F01DRAFT_1082562 [Mycena amicta]|nr:hypothetical protein C8F01DRAFT_1082562 [Mycena amicta]